MLGMEKIINEYPHETYFWQCIPSGASSMNWHTIWQITFAGKMAVHSGQTAIPNVYHLLIVNCSP
jgi:hypothetical protein